MLTEPVLPTPMTANTSSNHMSAPHLNTKGLQSFLDGYSEAFCALTAQWCRPIEMSQLYQIRNSSSPEPYPIAATGNCEHRSSLPFQGQRGNTQIAISTSELWVGEGKEQNKEKTCILVSQHLL